MDNIRCEHRYTVSANRNTVLPVRSKTEILIDISISTFNFKTNCVDF